MTDLIALQHTNKLWQYPILEIPSRSRLGRVMEAACMSRRYPLCFTSFQTNYDDPLGEPFDPITDFKYVPSTPRYSAARLYAMHLIDFARDLKVIHAEQSLSNLLGEVIKREEEPVNLHLNSLTHVHFKNRDVQVVYQGEMRGIQKMRRAFHKSSRLWVMHDEAPRKVYCGNALTAFEDCQDVRAYLHYLVYCKRTGSSPLLPAEWNSRRRR